MTDHKKLILWTQKGINANLMLLFCLDNIVFYNTRALPRAEVSTP